MEAFSEPADLLNSGTYHGHWSVVASEEPLQVSGGRLTDGHYSGRSPHCTDQGPEAVSLRPRKKLRLDKWADVITHAHERHRESRQRYFRGRNDHYVYILCVSQTAQLGPTPDLTSDVSLCPLRERDDFDIELRKTRTLTRQDYDLKMLTQGGSKRPRVSSYPSLLRLDDRRVNHHSKPAGHERCSAFTRPDTIRMMLFANVSGLKR